MRTAAARRERFLPYRYARGGVDIRVAACVLDGRDRIEPDRDAHLLELDVPWDTAVATIELTVPRSTHQRVAPSGAPADQLELLLVLRCPATFLRWGTRIPITQAGQPIPYELSLQRADLAGSADLHAYLVRKTAVGRSGGFASARGARVADSRSWELRLDRVRESRGEYLDVRYRRFSEDAAIPARDRPNLYVLDLDQDAPILWINAEHERVAGVLDSKGTVGRSARLREVFFDQIAQSVWTQLFLRAARDYVKNEETTYAWEDAVLDLLLKDIYPEVRNGGDRRDRLQDDWDDLPSVLRRLDAGLQRRNDVGDHLTKLVQEEDGA